MIDAQDPVINTHYEMMHQRIKDAGVASWLNDEKLVPSRDGLIYLCKFAFFTSLITKAELGRLLQLDKNERKQMVKGWYDDHRKKGCGTC